MESINKVDERCCSTCKKEDDEFKMLKINDTEHPTMDILLLNDLSFRANNHDTTSSLNNTNLITIQNYSNISNNYQRNSRKELDISSLPTTLTPQPTTLSQ